MRERVTIMEELKVAQAMRARPEAGLVLLQKGLTVTLDEPPDCTVRRE
jgi:hypothetical protein